MTSQDNDWHELSTVNGAIDEFHDALLILQRRDDAHNQAVESLAQRVSELKEEQDAERNQGLESISQRLDSLEQRIGTIEEYIQQQKAEAERKNAINDGVYARQIAKFSQCTTAAVISHEIGYSLNSDRPKSTHPKNRHGPSLNRVIIFAEVTRMVREMRADPTHSHAITVETILARREEWLRNEFFVTSCWCAGALGGFDPIELERKYISEAITHRA